MRTDCRQDLLIFGQGDFRPPDHDLLFREDGKLSESPWLDINRNLQLVSNQARHTGCTRLEPSHRAVANRDLRHVSDSIQTHSARPCGKLLKARCRRRSGININLGVTSGDSGRRAIISIVVPLRVTFRRAISPALRVAALDGEFTSEAIKEAA